MARRRLSGRGALAGLGEGLSNIGNLMLQDSLIRRRQLEDDQRSNQRALLGGMLQELNTIQTPEYVQKYGPEVAAQHWKAARGRFPDTIRQMIPETVNFTPFDSTEAQRADPFFKEVASAPKVSALPTEPDLRRRLGTARIKTDVPDQVDWQPGETTGFPVVTGHTERPSDLLSSLLKEIGVKREGLLAEEERKPQESYDPVTGLKTTDFPSNRELAGRRTLAERPTAQEAAREGQIAGAREFAVRNVQLNPDIVQREAGAEEQKAAGRERGTTSVRLAPGTIAGEARRAGAISGAQESATQGVRLSPSVVAGEANRAGRVSNATRTGELTADQLFGAGSFKPDMRMVEGLSPQGTKTQTQVNMTPQSAGQVIDTGITDEGTAQQQASYAFAKGAVAAHNELVRLEPAIMERGYWNKLKGLTAAEFNSLPQTVQDPLMQQYAIQVKAFINAGAGRPDSGGAITDDEWKQYQSSRSLMPGTTAEGLKAVQGVRRTDIERLRTKMVPRIANKFLDYDTARQRAKQQLGRDATDQELEQKAQQEGILLVR